MSLKDLILAADDRKPQPVPVPEWPGAAVFIRVMSGTERDAWESATFVNGKITTLERFRAKLLVRCLCDEQGNRIFTDDEVEALSAKSSTVLDRLYDVAQTVNALTKKDVDELTKNSSGDPAAASTTGSPSDSDAPSANS